MAESHPSPSHRSVESEPESESEPGCEMDPEPWLKLIDFSSPHFDIEEVRHQLTEYGVVIISNVIPRDDCDIYISQINKWLEQFGEYSFPQNIKSIIHKYNIAHLEPAWRMRLQVKAIFAQLWRTEKLLTSTDGIAIGRPPEMYNTEFEAKIPTDGWHFDQSGTKEGLHAYQGAVYMEEAGFDDWCFAVSAKSNNHHKDFFQQFKEGRSEFRKLNKTEMQWLDARGCTATRIPVPKGGIVLWDSRTAHAGAPPVFGREQIDRWRYVAFICQTPAIWATPEDMNVKRDAYEHLKCSRHWASYGVGNFHTKDSPQDITEMPDIAQTLEAQQLAGFKSYNFSDGSPNGPPPPEWKRPLPKWRDTRTRRK